MCDRKSVSFLMMGAIGFFAKVVFATMMLTTSMPEAVAVGPYPRESETREVKHLDGIWDFYQSDRNNPMEGVTNKWFMTDLSKIKPTIQMAVPASYNDLTQDANLRDHVGTVWYERHFFVPNSWKTDQRVFVRFESVHYSAIVWINGVLAVKHEFGHLPFEADITQILKYGKENRITVLCDNVLLQTTIPQGQTFQEKTDNGTRIQQSYTFDFFNYAGIHRSVFLYTTPIHYIEDVTIATDVDGTTGRVHFKIKTNTNQTEDKHLSVELKNKNGEIVSTESTTVGNLMGTASIQNVQVWWPYLMDENYGYLYTMTIKLFTNNEITDIYRLKVGVRTLTWNENEFLINGRKIYFHGFGKHEDADIRGKGFDYPILLKDFLLLKWIGANAIRTSHYPYSEELVQMADEHGIMIIDECASVDTENYTPALLSKHQENLRQLIHRDKNHPSVIMWSIANEPRTSPIAAEPYFANVAKYTRSLDQTRPITASIATSVFDDKAGKSLDIISFNRYQSWYSNPGKLDMIRQRTIDEACSWRKKYNKPVLISEYGADTVAGLHISPAYVWSEEFQKASYSQHFKAFDFLRSECNFIGEFVWNFADFKTAQTVTRVGGNKKGVFTRERQPKSAAYLLRKRYHSLSNSLHNNPLPHDLFLYFIDSAEIRIRHNDNLEDDDGCC